MTSSIGFRNYQRFMLSSMALVPAQPDKGLKIRIPAFQGRKEGRKEGEWWAL